MARSRRTSAALFIALGLVGAFIVSAIAGLWDEEPSKTGFRALGNGVEEAGTLRVEVLNGAGTAGLARDGMRHLRDDGFDVVFYGNAKRFDHARSVVLDRTGDLERARMVAAALGIDSVATAIDSSLLLEVTVVLGEDWPPRVEPEKGWRDRLREAISGDSASADSAAVDTGGAEGAGESAGEGG